MVAVLGYRLKVVAGSAREMVKGADGVAHEVGVVVDLAGGVLRIAGASESERLANAFCAGRDMGVEEEAVEGNVTPIRISDRARCGPPPGLTTDLSALLRRRTGDLQMGE